MNQILKRLFGNYFFQLSINRHYIEDVQKHPLSGEEVKWINYIHKEVIPSVTLYNFSSLHNIKSIFSSSSSIP